MTLPGLIVDDFAVTCEVRAVACGHDRDSGFVNFCGGLAVPWMACSLVRRLLTTRGDQIRFTPWLCLFQRRTGRQATRLNR